MYATSAWWGFTNATDRQRIEAFLRTAVQTGLYSPDGLTVTELVCDSDDTLFEHVLHNRLHVLHKLLPERSTHDYFLRHRPHDRLLCVRTDNRNFFSRLLFKDTY